MALRGGEMSGRSVRPGRAVSSRVVSASFVLLLAGRCLAAEPAAPDAPPIRAVWNETQSCHGPVIQNMTRSPDEATIRARGAVDLAALGVRYRMPYVPDVQSFALKVVPGDRSRGVVDHYVLMSDQDLAPPFGALVVTELPPDVSSGVAAFGDVDRLQHALAQSGRALLQRREFTDARLGPGVEYLAPNRVGTSCFPTSGFRYAAPESGLRTMGVSRFFVHGRQLVELSFIVRLPDAVPMSGEADFARAQMDRYAAGLTFGDAPR